MLMDDEILDWKIGLYGYVSDLRVVGYVPRVHGNGFIQLNLNKAGTRRLHVWHDDLPRQTVATPIHDHVFDMRSTVLTGTLIHEEITPVDDEDGTHCIYRAQQEEGTQNTILVPDEGRVSIGIEQRLVLGTGSVYMFPAGKLHISSHRGLTATMMQKIDPPEAYGRPRVLCAVGTEPDNEFDREGHDPAELWPYIFRALGRKEDA